MDLRSSLPALLPLAIDWAEAASAYAHANGVSLDERGQMIARRVGVQHPENVRLMPVDELPWPGDPALRAAADATGLLGPGIVGITLGYSVYVRRGFENTRLLSHEFRHVFQYERAGSIGKFLPVYLSEIIEVGYEDSPLEVDARKHEFDF